MRRITVDEIKEAYKATGLTPARNTWGESGSGCACGLGVLAVAAGVPIDDLCSDVVYDTINLDEFYGLGFTNGFDGNTRLGALSHRPGFNQGYDDGAAAAAAIFGEST